MLNKSNLIHLLLLSGTRSPIVRSTTLLEPVPPPSPYWGCSEGRILPLPIHSLHWRRLCWVHIATSYTDGFSGKRRGSRCLMCAGLSSSEKQSAFELDWGLFASSLTRPFLRPFCPLWRPVHGPPLAGNPAYHGPPPLGSPPNHPLQTPSPIHHLRQGSGLRVVPAAIPLSYTQDFSRSYLLLYTRAQGLHQPLAHPRLHR